MKTRRHIAPIIARLHEDQEGTTITEFVLLLPVFLTIFIGMINLSVLQHQSIDAHISATNQLWSRAIPVQKNSAVSGFTAYDEAQTRSLQNLASRNDPAVNNIRSFLSDRWNETGSMADSKYMMDQAYQVYIDQNEFDLNQYHDFARQGSLRRLITLETQGNSDLELPGLVDNVNPIISTAHARALMDETTNTPVSATARTNGMTTAAGLISGQQGTRMSVAAGARYGNVAADVDRSVDLGGVNFELRAQYEVLVAPFAYGTANDHHRTHGVTRLGMEEHDLYRTLPGIEQAETLKFNQSY